MGRAAHRSSCAGIFKAAIELSRLKNPAHIKDNFDLFDFSLTDEEMKKISSLDQKKRYYKSDEHLLRSYVKMVPDVDGQK